MITFPPHPDYLEDLDILPDRARVYKLDVEEVYDDDEPLPWQLDGAAVVDGRVAVTAACYNFPTWAQAIAAVHWIVPHKLSFDEAERAGLDGTLRASYGRAAGASGSW